MGVILLPDGTPFVVCCIHELPRQAGQVHRYLGAVALFGRGVRGLGAFALRPAAAEERVRALDPGLADRAQEIVAELLAEELPRRPARRPTRSAPPRPDPPAQQPLPPPPAASGGLTSAIGRPTRGVGKPSGSLIGKPTGRLIGRKKP